MEVLYLHYYIIDYSDIRKPRIMIKPFTHRYRALEVAKAYFKVGTYRIIMGYKLKDLDLFKKGKFDIWQEMANTKLLPNNIIDRRHRRRTRKQRETIEKRKNGKRLLQERWLSKCIRDDLKGFTDLLEIYWTTDMGDLNLLPGRQGLIEMLQGKGGPEDWNLINFRDYVSTLNILRVLILFDYDNGPFYRYQIAYRLWERWAQILFQYIPGYKDLA